MYSVGNIAHVHFAANLFNLPVKTQENPKGIFTEHELWMALCVIHTSIFSDFEATKSFPLKMVSRKLASMLGKSIETIVKAVTAIGFASRLFDSYRENQNALADYGIHMLRRLSETGMSAHDIAFSQIMPTTVAMVPMQSEAVSLPPSFVCTTLTISSLKSSISTLVKEKNIFPRFNTGQNSTLPKQMIA